MKVGIEWLREWVEVDGDPSTTAAALTGGGLEVDSIQPAGPVLESVVVAEVVAVERHPDAERLSVCQVSTGSDAPVQVVCGAPNVRPGLRVPFARPGAVLPGGQAIEISRIREVESHGMLCSQAELELGDDAAGIWELDPAAPTGKPLAEFLGLADDVLDIDLTPNRGDCLSVIGLARDLAALSMLEARAVEVPAVDAVTDATVPIELAAPAACARYCGRIIEGIDPHARTPTWMLERLRRCGVRGIHPVVDVTNYVMLELGQPMHAFDRARIDGGIVVRPAAAGEQLALLDGETIDLDGGELVIADHAAAVALAGVMGGADTGVTEASRDILLESAYFDPIQLAGTARRYRLHTDASHRFERGVDFTAQARATERATALIMEICGGRPGPTFEARADAHLPRLEPIGLRRARITRLLGIEMADDEVERILERLGLQLRHSADGWQALPPPYRHDLRIEADLVEELARVHGYDRIPVSMPRVAVSMTAPRRTRDAARSAFEHLIARGYQEVVTYSFIDPERARMFEPDVSGLALANPISSEMAVMRRSLWPGLVAAAQHNANRKRTDIRLFESGLAFIEAHGTLHQERSLAALRVGSRAPEQWGAQSAAVDFFDIKQDAEAVLLALGQSRPEWREHHDQALHPGQSAAVEVGGRRVGRAGRLHPRLARDLDLADGCVMFELMLDSLPEPLPASYRPISKFPAIRRDLSVVLPEQIPAGTVVAAVRECAGELLRDLQLFDVYRGQGIDSGKKSLSLGLIFQAPSSTLTDSRIDAVMQRVVQRLSSEFGGALRD